MYKKSNPEISYKEFIELVSPIKIFKSLRGHEYVVKNIQGDKLNFVRKSTGKKWNMDLIQALKAYKEITDFRTENFRTYVPRRHSPALGLLLHLGLLSK